MKISLRTSILILFATLLLAMCSSIIYVNHLTSIKFFVESAEKLLSSYSEKIEDELEDFLQPPKIYLTSAHDLIVDQVIIPDDSEKFTRFLLRILKNLPNASGIEWGDQNGNLYHVTRDPKNQNTFINQVILKAHKSVIRPLDNEGKIIGKPITSLIDFDPRLRPWYEKAFKAERLTISDVYAFYPFDHKASQLGITFAEPVYNKNKKLRGILAIDVKLNSLASFVTNLTVTPHSQIFVFDNKNNLIAAKSSQIFSGKTLPTIKDINIPWAKAAFAEYEKKKNPIFFYNYNSLFYIGFYDKYEGFKNSSLETTTAIILPLLDIIGDIVKQLIVSFIIIILVIAAGLIIVFFIANTLSKPMMKLASAARLIKQLDLSPTSSQKTPFKIKEMFDMQEAFDSMKQSLKSFIRYVPYTLVKDLITTGDIAHVGGENRYVTFLFSDITGFTALSEKMEPQKLMTYLSEYLENMTSIILAKDGTVDKYIGDAIMAFWNAPLDDKEHAAHACETALLMCECLEKLNQRWQKTDYPTLTIRIGINTGNATIGNVGSEDRLSYTAIGDSVNLTNRVEELNKIYKTKIIVTQHTYKEVKNQFSFRFLDHVKVRGKNISVCVYELLSKNQPTEELNKYNITLENAYNSYRKGNWEEAENLFRGLTPLYPNDQLANIYIERCHNFQNNHPENWDGTWRIE